MALERRPQEAGMNGNISPKKFAGRTLSGNGRFFPIGLFALALLAGAASPGRAQDLEQGARSQRFKAGEAIIIRVPLDTTSIFNDGYPIDAAGYAEIPVVGKIKVDGRRRQDVEEYLGQRLAQYLRDVHITALPAARLTLLGYWQRPGMVYVDANATLWDIVYGARPQVNDASHGRGPAGEDNILKLKAMRGKETLDLDILESLSAGATFADAGLKSGDMLVIPNPEGHHAWYWIRESLVATAQLATIITAIATVYITYQIYENQQ